MEGREILIAVVSVSDLCFNSVFGFEFGFHTQICVDFVPGKN
jgi:hypothetical protein